MAQKIKMMQPLRSPENPADAFTITAALTEPSILDALVDRFPHEVVDDVVDNSKAWIVETVNEAISVQLDRGHGPRAITWGEDTVPPGLSDSFEEPNITDSDPSAFDVQQSEVILFAMRRASLRQGMCRSALDFLARNAPNRVERMLSGLALTAAVGLLKLRG